ncbi:hypothetical protein SynWH8101_1434 [Synechococcus sp. WH 8101]|nr:hypothetical protein SynWH8101_1434 [Synechococcus sp. WH 8101]
MFVESIQQVHPDITEQSAAQLREFLVTAHSRHQSDSQVLSIGFQTLKQEILNEGYEWGELISMLVDLVSADMQEDQHGRFVAELDRLYASNASLLEVGSVMASDYSSALEELQLLIQEAQKEHETLAGMAGGTSKFTRTWKKNPNRTKMEKGEAIGVDVLEATVGLTLVAGGGILAYKGIKRAMTRGGGEEVQQVERLADNAARDTGPDEIIGLRERAMKDAREVMDTMNKVTKGEAVEFGGKASELTENSINNYAEGAMSSHLVNHQDHIKRILDERLSPSTWEEVSRTDEPRLRKLRSEVTKELKGHYKGQIEDFIRENPDATEMDLRHDTKALLDPDKQFNPNDVDEDDLVSRVMNDDSRLINPNVNFRKAGREARRAVNNDGMRIQPPDRKKGGENDGGRLDNDGELDSLLEAPGKLEEGFESGIENEAGVFKESFESELGGIVREDVQVEAQSFVDTIEDAEELEL